MHVQLEIWPEMIHVFQAFFFSTAVLLVAAVMPTLLASSSVTTAMPRLTEFLKGPMGCLLASHADEGVLVGKKVANKL